MSVQPIKKQLNLKEVPIKNHENVFPKSEHFFRLPVMFYHTIGLDPYESSSSEDKPGVMFHIYFLWHMINMMFVVFMEILFVIISFRNKDNFLVSCIQMGCIGFVFASLGKVISVMYQKKKMSNLVKELDSMFPRPRQKEQEQYNVNKYLKSSNRYNKTFVMVYVILVAINSMFELFEYIILWLMNSPNAEPTMPYVELAPWDYNEGWKFFLTYMSQAIAGYTATCGHISADLMIFAVTMQAIMHFDRLSRALKELQVREASGFKGGADESLRELQTLIAYHNKILGLTDVINVVFGIPLLMNFVACSMLVCFVGLQMTVGISSGYFGKLLVTLVAPTVEIYLLCSISQMLIDASKGVSLAVYEMNWPEADSRFRKMLIFVAVRAQKPVCLKATIFLDLSIETMSMFLGMTYKFFCAIRTLCLH
ncbi:odorant receptor 67a-like [Drosophila subpulchrella]|uniref:odorant receptor 67a-like n=1 Tax=Drosophila subpulchrella TaxID=1486046 RepID=UPI0018A12A2B|nr:odorant receptor 67a-like [Drosophila subpulchrella]